MKDSYKSVNCYSSQTGDYLEMPDRTRMCGEKIGKAKSFMFPSTSDHMNFMFQSDSYGSETGFNIEIRQIPYSCDFYHAKGNVFFLLFLVN